MMLWNTAMQKLRISHQANVSQLKGVYGRHTPLTEIEAARARLALENTGIPNAVSRFSAGFIRAALEAVTE